MIFWYNTKTDMNIKAIAIGGSLGWLFGGPFGALFGATLGNYVARELSARKAPVRRRDRLSEAYAFLGVSPDASDEAVRLAYRAKAKKYHPDSLKARGLPDDMVKKATEMMSRLNAALADVERSRK